MVAYASGIGAISSLSDKQLVRELYMWVLLLEFL
jgi:hypothetical protein